MSDNLSPGKNFLPAAMQLLAGLAASITGTYLLNRIQERQEREQRLARLEQLMETLVSEQEKS